MKEMVEQFLKFVDVKNEKKKIHSSKKEISLVELDITKYWHPINLFQNVLLDRINLAY